MVLAYYCHWKPKCCISYIIITVIYLCSCVFMSHFGRDLNQSGDGLPCRFQMLSCLAHCKQSVTITFQVSIIISH